MKHRFAVPLLICLLASQGCQWLRQLDADRGEELARQDHRACDERGYTWPSEAYVDCRRFRADDRQREQWMELQMARQQQRPQVGIRPGSPTEPYRAIDAETFRCFLVGEGGEAYIDCRPEGL